MIEFLTVTFAIGFSYLLLISVAKYLHNECEKTKTVEDRAMTLTTLTDDVYAPMENISVIKQNQPPFNVCVVKCKNIKEYFIRITYVSNGRKFLNSETYKNKSYVIKKAKKIAQLLGTDLKEITHD